MTDREPVDRTLTRIREFSHSYAPAALSDGRGVRVERALDD